MADTVRQRVAAVMAVAYVIFGFVAWLVSTPAEAASRIPGSSATAVVFVVWFAVGVLLWGTWWLTRPGRPEIAARLGWPLLAATVAPISLAAVATLDPSWSISAVAILWPLSALPLAEALATFAPDARRRRLALGCALACFAAAAVIGPQIASAGMAVPTVVADGGSTVAGAPTYVVSAAASALQGLLVAGVTVLPALVAGFLPRRVAGLGWALGRDQLVEGVGLAAVGLTPAVAGLVVDLPDPVLAMAALVAWAALVAAVSRGAIRPLALLTQRATVQRDLTVALAEAERVRLAADLHDGPLQGLALLVRRLDESGDRETAALARSIAAELRDVTGELRLPLLDHLGAGAAMEWLVDRVRRLSGDEIDLVRDDPQRPPAAVELALFRIAQEGLANAVRHGRPPIRIRYQAGPDYAALSIEDAGPGIEADADERARAAGRFGLLGMQQRAEQVGARLDLRRRPGGGTQVALEWRAGVVAP